MPCSMAAAAAGAGPRWSSVRGGRTLVRRAGAGGAERSAPAGDTVPLRRAERSARSVSARERKRRARRWRRCATPRCRAAAAAWSTSRTPSSPATTATACRSCLPGCARAPPRAPRLPQPAGWQPSGRPPGSRRVCLAVPALPEHPRAVPVAGGAALSGLARCRRAPARRARARASRCMRRRRRRASSRRRDSAPRPVGPACRARRPGRPAAASGP